MTEISILERGSGILPSRNIVDGNSQENASVICGAIMGKISPKNESQGG